MSNTDELRAAAQQALMALVHHTEQTRPIQRTADAIAALRAALAQPAASGEPVPHLLTHLYSGHCPDDNQPHSRDPECRACRAMDAAPQPAPAPRLKWMEAPRRSEWGAGMMEALVALGPDETLRLYADRDAVPMADAVLAVRPAPARVPPIVAEVLAELERATRKFPTWPTDPLHALAVLGERIEAFSAPQAADMNALVQRFLQWPVPAHIHPDGTPGQPGRTGTNLLDAETAKAMLQHVLGG